MSRIDFARLNHILIPPTKTGRDRFRQGVPGAIARPVARAFRSFTPNGAVLTGLWLIVGAFGLEVGVNSIYLLWSALTGLLVAAFIVRRFFVLEDVTLRTEHPARVTMGERLDVTLILENVGNQTYRSIGAEGPLLPWDGRYVGRRSGFAKLKANEVGRAIVPVVFVARGEHHLDPFHVGIVAPLGLTYGPTLVSGGLRFLVLPRPANVLRLQLDSTARHQPGGVALASRTGEARELIGLRPYRPGDPIRDLAYRAWARTGVPVVREYQQEYFTRFGLVLDTDVDAADADTFEASIRLAAGVLAHLVGSDALVDLLVVGGSLHRLTIGRSLGRLEQALDLLAVVERTEPFDAARTMSLLSPHLDRLSSVVVIGLADDEARRSVVEEIKNHGVGARGIFFGRDVDLGSIERNEEIVL